MGEIADTPEEKYQYQVMSTIDAESLVIARFIRNSLAPSLSLVDAFTIVNGLKQPSNDPSSLEDMTNKLLMTAKLTQADEVSSLKSEINEQVDYFIQRDRRQEEERARITEQAKRNYFEKNREGLKLKTEILDFAAAINRQELRHLNSRQKELVEMFEPFKIEIYLAGWFSPRWSFRGSNTYANFRKTAETVEGQDFELFMAFGSHSRAISHRNFRNFGGLSITI